MMKFKISSKHHQVKTKYVMKYWYPHVLKQGPNQVEWSNGET